MQEQSTRLADAVGVALKDFLEQAVAHGPSVEPVFVSRLRAHFGAEPASLPIIEEVLETAEQPNLQLALEAYLNGPERSAQWVGIVAEHKGMVGVGLAELLTQAGFGRTPVTEGPVEFTRIELEPGRVLTCIESGLLLIREPGNALAVLVSGGGQYRGYGRRLQVEVMAADREHAERFWAGLRTLMRKLTVYRGRVLSLDLNRDGTLKISFHSLPRIERDQIVLPNGTLERIERHTVGFTRQRDRLLAAGRHLKRGILLHGAPGTGKTLTAMYLASRMPDHTVVLVTGRGAGLLPRACAMARMLQPSIVILEDADLVAEERTQAAANCLPLLFELLNEMDGLAEDTDVVFLLTSNRPELLEPALASRPGRIDQAVHVPLPDASCRARLFDLYSRGLRCRIAALDSFITRTEGTSGAFIRELLRRAALRAADENGEMLVEERHLDDALHELVVDGGDLTRSLLGGRPSAAR